MENEKIISNENESTETVETVSHEQTLKLMSPMQMVIRRFFRSKLSIIGLVMVVSLTEVSLQIYCHIGIMIPIHSSTSSSKKSLM